MILKDEVVYLDDVSYTYDKNPTLHIKNSYKIDCGAEIIVALDLIHKTEEYKKLLEAGYTRTFQSEFNEWKAHNILYKMGIARARTGSVDISQNESKLFRLGYVILSKFGK